MKSSMSVLNVTLQIITFRFILLSHPVIATRRIAVGQRTFDSTHIPLIAFRKERRRPLFDHPWTHHAESRKRSLVTTDIVINAIDALSPDTFGWFQTVTEFLPISGAAAGLHQLYSQVFVEALRTWVNDDIENAFIKMSFGSILLEMKSLSDAAIAWMFVPRFSARMKQATTQGFHGSYTAVYQYPQGLVEVTLRMLAQGRKVHSLKPSSG